MRHVIEDRRLKATGLALVAVATLLIAKLAADVNPAHPLQPALLGRLLLGAVIAVNAGAAGLVLLAVGCGHEPPWRSPRGRRALLLRVLLANVLVPAVAYATLTSDDAVAADFEVRGWNAPLSGIATVSLIVAWRLWQRAGRWQAVDADTAMLEDTRPPVLYLRSFVDDGVPVLEERGSLWTRMLSWIGPMSPEQELAAILKRIGPVVAIGRPGEALPELGAARLYVSNEEWQHRVLELMGKSALVVVRVGGSAGVQWEIDTALATVPRHRLVFVLAGGADASTVLARLAESLRTNLGAVAPDPVPRGYRSFWRDPRRRLGGVVAFTREGTLLTIPVSAWPPWGRDMWTLLMMRPSALPLRRAFRELFNSTGLGAGALGATRSRAVAVVLAMFFGYAGAHWFYLGQRRKGWTYVCLLPAALASMFLGWRDALQFVWQDHVTFQSRWGEAEPLAWRRVTCR